MEYGNAVAKGRTLLARTEHDQWELAWLTYYVLVERNLGTIAKWASDLGVSETHVNNLRNVWAQFGEAHRDEDRSNQTFNECYTLAGVSEERRKRIERAAKRTGRSVTTVHRTGRDRPKDRHEDRVRKARDLIGDEAVARDLLRDPKSRRILKRRLREADAEAGTSASSAHPRSQEELVDQLETLLASVNGVLGEMAAQKLQKGPRRSVLELVPKFRNSVDWMEAYAKSGARSLAEGLQRMLAEGIPAEPPPSSGEVSGPRERPAPRREVVPTRTDEAPTVDAGPSRERPGRDNEGRTRDPRLTPDRRRNRP